MPIIVDKRKGQRSVHLVNNKPNIMEDLIQDLRGLNFKFEVSLRIVDVTKDEPVGEELTKKVNEPLKSAPLPDLVPVQPPQAVSYNINKLNEKLNDHLGVAGRSASHPQPIPVQAEPEPDQVEHKFSPSTPPLPQQQPVDPMLEQPINESVKQPIKYTRNDILQVVKNHSPIKQQNAKEVPQLIKGSLKVGTLIRCPCIAVDEEASENVAYIAYDTTKLYELSRLLAEEIDVANLPIPESVSVGDIVLAQSSEDGCWYRAMIESYNSEKIVIFFFDWGLREQIEPVDYSQIRFLDLPEVGLSRFPACAMKIKFNALTEPEVVQQFLRCETEAQIKVLAYDVDEDTYTAHVSII